MKTRVQVGLLVLFALVAVWFGLRSGQPLNNTPAEKEHRPLVPATTASQPPAPSPPEGSAAAPVVAQNKPPGPPPENVALFKALFAQVIALQGRAIDQEGHAIEGAHVQLTVHDRPGEESSRYDRTSDSDGRFEIAGVNGASINVEVSKDGYYSGKESRRVFDAGTKTSKETPALFVLHKKGEAEPLVYLRSDTAGLGDEGGVAYLDFKRGRFTHASNGSGQMRVEIVSSPGRQRGRAWRYKITVPGGGLQRRTHEFAFIAPEAGYVETVEGGYGGDAADDPNWRGSFGDQFFARLPDGSVARFQVNLGIKGGSYVEISEFVYNFDPSSRNLEYDPAKGESTSR